VVAILSIVVAFDFVLSHVDAGIIAGSANDFTNVCMPSSNVHVKFFCTRKAGENKPLEYNGPRFYGPGGTTGYAFTCDTNYLLLNNGSPMSIGKTGAGEAYCSALGPITCVNISKGVECSCTSGEGVCVDMWSKKIPVHQP
jgi:hypothetical protein